MKNKLTARKLSDGGLFIFNEERKDLYLISKVNLKHWEKSNKDLASLKGLVGEEKAEHFDRTTLSKITSALSKVTLLG